MAGEGAPRAAVLEERYVRGGDGGDPQGEGRQAPAHPRAEGEVLRPADNRALLQERGHGTLALYRGERRCGGGKVEASGFPVLPAPLGLSLRGNGPQGGHCLRHRALQAHKDQCPRLRADDRWQRRPAHRLEEGVRR